MTSEKGKLYALLIFACLAGYIWIILNSASDNSRIEVCLIKHATDIPCPSCGSTRAILSIFDGNLIEAVYWNPFGFILIGLLFICPLWVFYDILKKTSTLFTFYKQTELFLKHRWVAAIAICLVLGNWAWNIFKGL